MDAGKALMNPGGGYVSETPKADFKDNGLLEKRLIHKSNSMSTHYSFSDLLSYILKH